MGFKPFIGDATNSIPIWIIILSAIVFFPLAVGLIVLRLKNSSKTNAFAGKLLFATGIFWLFADIVIMTQWFCGSLKTTTGADYPLGSFLLIVTILLILAWLYLSSGHQLLQHNKPQSPSIVPKNSIIPTSNPSAYIQPIICPGCGASNPSSDECEYCGTPLHF